MPVTTESFDGFTCRDDLATFVANAAVGGAPFARSLTPLPTERGGVAFPTVAPDGFDWVSEGAPIPEVDLHDDANVVAVAKLAGLVKMSNEFVGDNELPISNLLRDAVADSMGPKLDVGLLFGGGAPEPNGILALAAESVIGPDFRSSIIGAWGELVDAGANPESIVAFASAGVVAWELGRTNDQGTPVHADGAAAMVGPGIKLVAVPSLSAGATLVADVSRLFLVLRDDFEAKFSEHAAFANDQTVMRVKGRFAIACPTPGKALRVIPNAS
ncbi:MAG: phage major capsid protein [Actinobacteria bacterium]|nr:phage major capsid protein [Actinomycetota bacterium]